MRKSILNKKIPKMIINATYEKALFPFYDKLWELRFGKTSKVTIICSSNLSAVYKSHNH